MGMITVRKIPDEVHNALKARAKRHNRSAEAEVRTILEEATRPETRLRLGDELSTLSRKTGLTNEDFDALDQGRDQTPAEPMRFE